MSDELTRAIDQRDRLARAVETALRLADRAAREMTSRERDTMLMEIRAILLRAPMVLLAESVQVSEAQADAAVLRDALREAVATLPTDHPIRDVAIVALQRAGTGRRFLEAAYVAREALEPLVLAAAQRERQSSPQRFYLVSVSDAAFDSAVEAATGLPARPCLPEAVSAEVGWAEISAHELMAWLSGFEDAGEPQPMPSRHTKQYDGFVEHIATILVAAYCRGATGRLR